MGGEGSMASEILGLKQNRALLKKRSIRELKDLVQEKSGKIKLEFKKITRTELELTKENIRKEARKSARQEILIYLIFLAFILLGLCGIYLILV